MLCVCARTSVLDQVRTGHTERPCTLGCRAHLWPHGGLGQVVLKIWVGPSSLQKISPIRSS